MTTDSTVSAFRHPDTIDAPLTTVLRDGARRLLAEAIAAEASAFLAAIAMALALFSFPMTALLTEGLLQIGYFSHMHILCLFLVLSVVAEDVFVFVDAWRQSERVAPTILKKDDRKGRMAYTFRRASRAMAVTSSTTAATFLANYFNQLVPLRSFGVFAGLAVVVNAVQVVFIFPSAIMLFEDRFHRLCSCKRQIHAEQELMREVGADGLPIT